MFFPAEATRYPYSTKDAHHKITYGTPNTLRCIYTKISKIIHDNNGHAILAVAWTMFPKGTMVNYDDKIILPDGTFSPIVSIHTINDHRGREVCVIVYYGEGSI